MRSEISPRTPWIVATVCTYGMMMIYLTQVTLPFTVSLFLKPESAAFGWGRATLSGGVTISTIVGGVLAPFAGRLIDRWGSRRVIIPGAIIFALATMAMALTNGSIIQLYILFALLGASIRFSGEMAFSKLITGWFKKKRGMALGLYTGIGTGIGAAAGPWGVAFLIDHLGWRGAYLAIGVIILALKVPPYFLLRDVPPEQAVPDQVAPDQFGPSPATKPQLEGKTLKEAMHTRAFWLILMIVVSAGMATGGVLVHLLPLMEGRGLSESYVKTLLSGVAISSTAGRIITGYLLDRYQSPLVALPVYLSVLLGVLMIDHGSVDLSLPAALVLGFDVGAEGGGIIQYLTARYFGLRAFAEITGYVLAGTVIGLGIGPLVVGKLFDITGSYELALKVLEVSVGLGVIGILLLGPYVFDTNPSGGTRRRGSWRLSAK
jgi:MFS family permease